MAFIAPSGRRFPDTLHFDPDEVRRILPKRLRDQGWSEEDIERAKEAVEEIIRTAEPAEVGTEAKND